MSDAKLFQTGQGGVKELVGQSMTVEKSLQTLIENNLEAFLGVRLLASEYTTGKTHAGRIDTLGLDENHCAVIVEYKRTLDESVINQGLYYLDWLLDHKAEFRQSVMNQFGQDEADKIDWGAPRLICIAGDFTKYDKHAVNQIDRNIELLRYKRYGDELLLLDLVNTKTAKTTSSSASMPPQQSSTVQVQAGTPLANRFEDLKTALMAFGEDVQMNTLMHYIAFKRIKNFACVEIQQTSGRIVISARVDPNTVALESGFAKDVSQIGHHGTGDLQISIGSDADLVKALPLLRLSYEAS